MSHTLIKNPRESGLLMFKELEFSRTELPLESMSALVA